MSDLHLDKHTLTTEFFQTFDGLYGEGLTTFATEFDADDKAK